jgi:hypothetical protein
MPVAPGIAIHHRYGSNFTIPVNTFFLIFSLRQQQQEFPEISAISKT